MAVSSKRREMDIMKLMMSDYQVEMLGDGAEFLVDFDGPKGTFYEGGQWKVKVALPADYPYRSPSIGFNNRIFHPNVDETSGSVCLDVINQTWSPMYELLNIFDMFLPQLLSYPNASDPLNNDAAALMLQDMDNYERKVREYVSRYASGHVGQTKKTRHPSMESDSSVSTACSETSQSSNNRNNTPSPTNDSANRMEVDESSTSSSNGHTQEEDIDDDLSSLSDSSDQEDNLVLDL